MQDFGHLAVDTLSDFLNPNNKESGPQSEGACKKLGVGKWHVHISRKHYRCAEKTLEIGDHQNALKHLEQCIQRTPNWPQVHLLKSKTHEQMEDYASAIGSYRSALALIQCNEFDLTVDSESDQPIATDPPPDEGMGSPEKEREQELQEKTQMKSTHAVAVTLRHSMLPHLIRLYFQYYQSFLRAGSKQEAQVQLRQVGSLTNEYCLADQSNTDSRTFTPGHLIILKPMIEFYRNDECDRMEGLHILNHAIQFLESNAEIDENFAKLIEKLREDGTFVIIPALVELYLARAQIHLSCHRVMDAYEDSQRVKSICPDHPAVEQLLQSLGHLSTEQRKRAMQLALKGRLDESLIHLTLAIAANPLNPILYLERSVVHRRKGQYWKALDDLCRAVHFQSDSQSNKMEIMRTAQNQIFVTLIELVLQWYFDGQACIALYLIDNVIDAVPNYFLPYLIKADCYVQLNAKQNAVIHYERSLNCLKLTDPMLVRHTIVNRICQTRLSLALSAMTHLNWKGAEQELDHCVDYEPLVPEFHAFRGRVYYQLGKKEQAWQELLACCYLYISDWALNMRTSGRWSELPISVKDRLVVHLTRKLEWSAGSLISSFVAHPMALRELANGKCCVPVAQKINQFLRQYKSIGIERRNPWLSGCSRGKNLRDFLKAPWPRFEIESSRLSSLCSSRSSQSHSLIREKKQIKAQVEQIRAKRRG